MDLVSIETGLLHDVVEDTSVTIEDIHKNFGEDVARCVDGVTKLSKLDFFSAEERQAESFRKMLLAMVNDIRVIIVKLADRLHNMRTLGFIQEPERRERIARETIEIYGPIAHRLGMGKIRGELEDLVVSLHRPGGVRRDHARPGIGPARQRRVPHADPPDDRGRAAARGHSGARRGPAETRLLDLSEDEAPENNDRAGLRSDGHPHRHRFGKQKS